MYSVKRKSQYPILSLSVVGAFKRKKQVIKLSKYHHQYSYKILKIEKESIHTLDTPGFYQIRKSVSDP